MPAAKSKRVSDRKALRNRPLRSRAKTEITKARTAIDDGDDGAQSSVQDALIALDRAAQKGAIHKRNAARRKSRLMQQLNKAAAAE